MVEKPKKLLSFLSPTLILCVGVVLIWNYGIFSKKISIKNLNNETEEQYFFTDRVSSTKNENFIPNFSTSVSFNPHLFYPAIQKYPKENKKNDEVKIVGAIVPHHDLASDLIAEVFQKISKTNSPKKIILIGPNHPDSGAYSAQTANINWNVLNNRIETEQETFQKMLKFRSVGIDNEIVSKEHSIFTLLPFVTYYFPEAKVTPIILTSTHDLRASKALAESISPLIDEDTLILASIDFSHYLPSTATYEKDKISKSAIEKRNYELIAALNNDYLDSPPSLITFLKIMDLNQASKMEIVSNTNSGFLLGKDVESSTSYFTILFSK